MHPRRLEAVARGREASDWDVDRARARAGEREVAASLSGHRLLSDLHDRSGSMETPDFEVVLDGRPVRLELKEKHQPYDPEIAAIWPDRPEPQLVLVDELSLRRLVWADGGGYLLIADRGPRRWLLFGPWELWLAPRRRYERPGNAGGGTFLKGKVLLDAGTAASTTPEFDVDALIEVVRRSRRAITQIEAVEIPGHGPLPTVPRVDRSKIEVRRPRQPGPRTTAPLSPTVVPEEPGIGGWGGLSDRLVGEVRRRWGWRQLTAVQLVAIPAILGQQSTLVLGPTAGGKTEAAMLPLLDRWQLEFAHGFLLKGGDVRLDIGADASDESAVIPPTLSTRHGPVPLVLYSDSPPLECLGIAEYCAERIAKGSSPGSIAALYGSRWAGGFDWLTTQRSAFERLGVPYHWATNPEDRNGKDMLGADPDPDRVVLSTIHSAKGPGMAPCDPVRHLRRSPRVGPHPQPSPHLRRHDSRHRGARHLRQ